jgi:hypothetical protein
MPESPRDLMAVLLGLVVLWFLLGTLVHEGRLRGSLGADQCRRRPMSGRPHRSRSLGR